MNDEMAVCGSIVLVMVMAKENEAMEDETVEMVVVVLVVEMVITLTVMVMDDGEAKENGTDGNHWVKNREQDKADMQHAIECPMCPS